MIYHLASGNPLLWINTYEYDRTCHQITDEVNEHIKRNVYSWDIVRGVVNANTGKVEEPTSSDPRQPIEFMRRQKVDCVMIANDYHLYFGDIDVWRNLLNHLETFKEERKSFVVVSPLVTIPPEITPYVTLYDMPLPTYEQLLDKTRRVAKDLEVDKEHKLSDYQEIARAAKGLSEYELENALALSATKYSRFTKEFITEVKKQAIKKVGSLEFHESKVGFEAVIGLDKLKSFTKAMVGSGQGKGVLVIGHPGMGKSHLAKCLGKETNRPTIVLDPSKQMGSLVGQTEQQTNEAIKAIDAQDSCIVFIDELEKAFSGVNDQANSTGIRQGKALLQWMNDRTSDSYIIATANDISRLPAEFLRAERWDAIFFADLPSEKESQELLAYYTKEYDVKTQEIDIEGWTGAEVKSLCRIASSLKVDLHGATKYVRPICKFAHERVDALRQWAEPRCINASSSFEEEAEQTAVNKKSRAGRAVKLNESHG
jgi:predicted AAA+ superfamily ATPase